MLQSTLQQVSSQQWELQQQVDVNASHLEKERHQLAEQIKKVWCRTSLSASALCFSFLPVVLNWQHITRSMYSTGREREKSKDVDRVYARAVCYYQCAGCVYFVYCFILPAVQRVMTCCTFISGQFCHLPH